MTRTMVRGGSGVRAAAVLSLALVVSTGAAACGASPDSSPTSRVERGTVATRVSASGALASVTSQNLGFQKSAQLKELNVKVGDLVQPGQVLARQDDFTFRQALQQAEGMLQQQEATLSRLKAGVAVPNAEASLDQVRKILDKTKTSVDKQVDAARLAAHRAKLKWETDQKAYNTAKKDLADKCPTQSGSVPDPSGSSGGGGAGGGGMDPTAGTGSALAADPSTGGGSAPSMPSAPRSPGGLLGGLGSAIAQADPAQCEALKQKVVAAAAAATASKTAYLAAKSQAEVVEAGGAVTVENARNSVVTAENLRRSASADRPGTIEAQEGLVASARAAVALANRDVENSVLRAPVGGSVSAITGAVGEYVSGAAMTTALAPGTNASIPGVGAAASSDSAGQASSGLSATRPGGGAFIVLNNVNTFQVVVPFEESDAAKVSPNQKVRVTFDAIPDLERDGTVLSIAPSGTNISGVTNYYATILLLDSDPRLRAGLTAEAGVETAQTENVLMVPNAAITKQGGQSFVNIPGPDGKPMRKQFEPGMVGDTTTEVRSGLNQGQEVLITQANPGGPGGRGGSIGGGGGGVGGGN